MSRRFRVFEQEVPGQSLVRVTVILTDRMLEQVTERPGTGWRARYRSNRCTSDASAEQMFRDWCNALRSSLKLVLASEGDEDDPREIARGAASTRERHSEAPLSTILP